MAITLPTKKSGISKKWSDQKFLMMGASGIGKSSFWSHAENPLYIEAEAGLNFIDAFKMPVRTWEEVAETMKALLTGARDGNFPYDVVIVDTVDRILACVESEVMSWAKGKYSKGSEYGGIGDIPEGAGWYQRENYMNKFLKVLETLPCAVAIIGHLDEKEIKEDGMKSYHKATISIGGKVGCNILSWSDHTLHVKGIMQGDTLKRTVYTKPTKSREAKSRGGVIKDGWIWDEDDAVNFKKLREQFD